MLNRENIQKSIEVIKGAKANQISRVSRFRDEKGMFCLNGLIMEQAGGGYDKVADEGVIIWMDNFYGNVLVGNKLTEYHLEYIQHKADFIKIQQKTLRYLRGLLKK